MGNSRRVRRSLLALGLLVGLAGCGGGGGGGGSTPTGGRPIATARGVPQTITVRNSPAYRLGGGGDDYLLILSEPYGAGGTASVRLNGGTTTLPLLGSRAPEAGAGRHVPIATWNNLLAGRLGSEPPTRQLSDPPIGSQRRFTVLTGEDRLVTATLREKGRHCLLYVDNATAAGALTAANMADLRRDFDDHIYPTTTGALGPTGDVDGNNKVIFLLTPTLPLTGYGYFYPGDLLGANNSADMLYMTVPRPHLNLTYERLRSGLLATMAHELAHLINFNHKKGIGSEESWLNEGLSFVSEQLNGYLDSVGGSPENVAYYFRSPERYTGRELSGDYLDGHAGVNYLFVRYLADRFGEDVLPRLVTSRLRGQENVRQATGQEYAVLQPQFAAALYLSGTGLSADPRYQLTGFDTRGEYPLVGAKLHGPQQTVLSAASGQPRAAITWARGGLRYLRFTRVPAAGAYIQLSTADATIQATFLRLPATAP